MIYRRRSIVRRQGAFLHGVQPETGLTTAVPRNDGFAELSKLGHQPVSLTEVAPHVPSHEIPRRPLPRWADELGNHRARLSGAWSDQTRYDGTPEPFVDQTSESRGQCGVSSAWLIKQLIEHVDEATLFYCYGHVYRAGTRSALLSAHCWVEVGLAAEPDRYVIDLTGDQIQPLRSHPVLCLPHDEVLEQLGVDYAADRARLAPRDVAQDLVQPRLLVLEANLARGI